MQITIKNKKIEENPYIESFNQYKKMRPEDRENLQDRYNYLMFIISNKSEGHGEDSIIGMNHLLDIGEIQSEANRIKRILDFDESLNLRIDKDRVRLISRMRELEYIITKNFPSWKSQMATIKSSGELSFEQSVQQSLYFMRNFTKHVEEWKQIKNKLEPNDPEADNVYILARQGDRHEGSKHEE